MGKNLKGKELGKNLYQRKDGRYEVRACINGIKINYISKNLSDVKKKLTDARLKASANINPTVNYTLDTWFYEWFERYKEPRVKQTSVIPLKRSYKNNFGIYIGNKPLITITSDDVQDVINDLHAQGKAASTVRSALSLLQQCFERAVHNRYISNNPCFDLFVYWEKEKTEKLSRFLSIKEQERFLEESEVSWYKEMFYIMFYTGLRVGEVGGLRWEDVDFKNKCINIKNSLSCSYSDGIKTEKLTAPKTPNSYRTIPFIGDVELMFREQRNKQDRLRKNLGERWRSTGELEQIVFCTTQGSPISRYVAEREINNIVKSINYKNKIDKVDIVFENVYPHAIRHTFCSRCFERGVNPKVVQKLMGHAHYSTTIDIYTHVSQENIRNEANKLLQDDFDETKNELTKL